ncbi:hypothetical protein ADL04_28000 [Streptomyces sp. NRRL B-3648]|nr:hypothetical protein [Streptomyces sp. NRRL B-3648]KOV93288.1 hypothetical protein ADL04_28000 [Streptomyces sp. NRRL B-3648]
MDTVGDLLREESFGLRAGARTVQDEQHPEPAPADRRSAWTGRRRSPSRWASEAVGKIGSDGPY